MSELYEDDLAYVHAAGFGDFVTRAIDALIPRLHAIGARRVVDVGCGAGVSTRALVRAGFETLAIEPSGALLAMARVAAPGATFRQASAYDVELPPCDAVLALGEPLTYHAPEVDADARVRGLFAVVRDALRAGGLLAFDVLVTGEPSLDARGFRTGDDWAVLSESREDRGARRLTRTVETFRGTPDGTYRRGREVHHVRLFEEGEVRGWLEELGFTVEIAEAYGELPMLPRRKAFLATRRGDDAHRGA